MITRSQTRHSLLFVIVSVSCLVAESTVPFDSPSQRHSTNLHSQTFVCNLGYTPIECHKQSQILQKAVHQYHAEDLGSWTWILVRAEDWKDLMKRLHLNPESPAFTAIDLRETVLEESLITPRPERAKELMDEFRTPLDQLLSLAVTHELGHVICNCGTEYLAEKFGEQLRAGSRPRYLESIHE